MLFSCLTSIKMAVSKFVIFLVLSHFLADGVYGSYCIEKNCTICQDNPVNLTYDEVYPKFKELVHRIWKQDIALTNLGLKYKNIVLNLTENGNADSSLLSVISTIYLNNFIPYLDQKPDACAMAAVINGTLSCVVNHDDTAIQSALTQLQTRFYDINTDAMSTMILSSGCDFRCGKSPPDPKIKKTSCYKNGFVYPIKQLWDIPNGPYSNIAPELRKIVLDLYKSNNHIDNFIASCTTFALSEITQRIFAKWDPNNIVEAVGLELSAPIQQKCCYSRMTRAEEVRKSKDANAIRTITNEKAYLSVTKCK